MQIQTSQNPQLLVNNQQMINQRLQSFESVKTPDSDVKIPFKNSLNINRAERLLAKEMREQNLNAVLQDAWKCKCMLNSSYQSQSNLQNKDLKIIDHLQKRNCQQCGSFIIGIGNEEEDPLTLTICDKNGNSEKRILFSSGKKDKRRQNESSGKPGAYTSGQKQDTNSKNQKSNAKIKTLKQKEDHFFADMSPSEIYSYLRLEESSIRFKQIQGRFVTLSPQLMKQRKLIVESIFDFGEKLKQRILTTHLAVVLVDILLQDDKIFEKVKQETLACICLLLASKFDEVDDNIPLIRDLQKVCAKQRVIGYEEMLKAEQTVLFKLNWDLFKLAPMHFLQNLLGQGIVFSNDRVQPLKSQGVSSENKTPQYKNAAQINTQLFEVDEKTLKSVKKHAEFFADLAIQEYELQKTFRPSVVAISCIVLARKMSRIVPEWNSIGLEELTDYTYEGEVKSCADKLYKVYQKQIGALSNTNSTPINNNGGSNSKNFQSNQQLKTPNKTNLAGQQTTSNGKSDNKLSNNKHNKENQESEKTLTKSASGQSRSLIAGIKGTQNLSTQQINPVVNKIQFVQKSQIIQEENEQPSQISHNTTRSNDSQDVPKLMPQLTLSDLLDPYQLFDHSLDNNIQLRKEKPQSKQQPQKLTDETKLTLTNSYSSDPQSPSMMTYLSQHTSTDNNSKITSQNKNLINQTNTNNTTAVASKNHSLVRKQESSSNIAATAAFTAASRRNQNTQNMTMTGLSGTQNNNQNNLSNNKNYGAGLQTSMRGSTNQAQSKQRNLSKNRSQPHGGFLTITNQQQQQTNYNNQSNIKQNISSNYSAANSVGPSNFSSAVKLCPQSTKNQNKDADQTSKKTPAATLLSSKQNPSNTNSNISISKSSSIQNLNQLTSSRNNATATMTYGVVMTLNGLESNNINSSVSQTFEVNNSVKKQQQQQNLDVFHSQKSQVALKKGGNSTNRQSTLFQSNIGQKQLGISQSVSKEQLKEVDIASNNVTNILSYEVSKDAFSTDNIMSITQPQISHRHQLSMVPSTSNLPSSATTSVYPNQYRGAKRSMDLTASHKHSNAYNLRMKNQQTLLESQQQPQTTKNHKQPKSSIKVYQDSQRQKQQSQQQIISQDNSVTRICTFDTQLALQQNFPMKIQQQTSQINNNELNNKNNDSSKEFKQPISRTSKKIFDRKKSSAIRNTTLEQICENKHENFMISPSQQQQHNVHTAKNITSSQNNVMQSFSLATVNSNQNITSGINSNVSYNNYIQRNITYVNKLNQMVKDKKTNEQVVSVMQISHTNSKSTTNILQNIKNNSTVPPVEKQKSSTKLHNQASTYPYNSTAEIATQNSQVPPLNSIQTLSFDFDLSVDGQLSTFSKNQKQQQQSQLYSQMNQQTQNQQLQQYSQNTSTVMSFNSRRGSEFRGCDYLKPTLSSMSRAKSVAPGMKRSNINAKESRKINQVQNVSQNTLIDCESGDQASFELETCKNLIKSPLRQGPIQVYEKTKSNQKRGQQNLQRQDSGVKRQGGMMQFRGSEDHSSERLRIGQFLSSKDGMFASNSLQQQTSIEMLSTMQGMGMSRQSLGKRQSFSSQQNIQPRLGNKSQRNSVSLSFSLNPQNTSQLQDDSAQNCNTNSQNINQRTSKFIQNKKSKPVQNINNNILSNNKLQKKCSSGLLRKLSSTNQNASSTQSYYQDTQQTCTSAGNLLSARSIGGAAIPEEEEIEEGGVLQSNASVSNFTENNRDSDEVQEDQDINEEDEDYNENQITHEYNFDDEEEEEVLQNNEKCPKIPSNDQYTQNQILRQKSSNLITHCSPLNTNQSDKRVATSSNIYINPIVISVSFDLQAHQTKKQ